MLYCVPTSGKPDYTAQARMARRMRESLDLTQEALAQRIHCSFTAVSGYETGYRPVPAAYLATLAAIVAVNFPDDPTPLQALQMRCEACEIHAGRIEIQTMAQRRIRRAA